MFWLSSKVIILDGSLYKCLSLLGFLKIRSFWNSLAFLGDILKDKSYLRFRHTFCSLTLFFGMIRSFGLSFFWPVSLTLLISFWILVHVVVFYVFPVKKMSNIWRMFCYGRELYDAFCSILSFLAVFDAYYSSAFILFSIIFVCSFLPVLPTKGVFL